MKLIYMKREKEDQKEWDELVTEKKNKQNPINFDKSLDFAMSGMDRVYPTVK